jgi:hypothetical protein
MNVSAETALPASPDAENLKGACGTERGELGPALAGCANIRHKNRD